MKILANRQALLASWGAVASVVPTRSPKPILQSILIRATDEETTLTATDLEVGIVHRVRAVKVDQPGSAVLPPRVGEILRKSSDDEISIETEGDNLTIRGLRSKFELASEDPNLFPTVPEFDAADYYEIASAPLRAGIKRTAFATDVESTRYALGGVLWELNGHLSLVATNGRCLALQPVDFERIGEPPSYVNGDAATPAPVVPLKCMKLLEKILSDDGPPIHLAVINRNAILIRTEEATIYSRLVEGRFPRYHDVFPGAANHTIPLAVADLLGGTSQASILTSEESRGVDFMFAGGILTLASQSADRGASHIDLTAAHDGAAVGFTLDPEYLTPMLRSLPDGAEVTLKIVDDKNGLVFEYDSYRYVTMLLTRDR